MWLTELDLVGAVLEGNLVPDVSVLWLVVGALWSASARPRPRWTQWLDWRPRSTNLKASARAEPPTERLVVVGAGLDVDVQPAMSAPVSSSAKPAPFSPDRPAIPRTFPLITGRL